MGYFAMAMALFAGDDYEEVATRLFEAFTSRGCREGSWTVPTSGGITQARLRLGHAPLHELFSQVAVPGASLAKISDYAETSAARPCPRAVACERAGREGLLRRRAADHSRPA
jgi:hypothetical protein